jgi:hypothetical protein
MKRAIAILVMLVLSVSVYSLDIEKARKAIIEYTPTNPSYISMLTDYGFTEQKMKAWRYTGIYIGWYLQQLAPILNGYGQPNPDMAMTTIRNTGGAMGELSAQELTNMEQFIKDMAEATIQLRDIALAERQANRSQVATPLPQPQSAPQQAPSQPQATPQQSFPQSPPQADERTQAEYDAFVQQYAEATERSQEEQAGRVRRMEETPTENQQRAPAPVVSAPTYTAGPDTIVYRTSTGDKYHLDGCSSLRRSKFAIKLENAVRLYAPCERCNPPRLR